MLRKTVQVLELVKHFHAQVRHMLPVPLVCLVPVRQNAGKVEHFRLQILRMPFRTDETAEEFLLIAAIGNNDVIQVQTAGNHFRHQHGGQQGIHPGKVGTVNVHALLHRGAGHFFSFRHQRGTGNLALRRRIQALPQLLHFLPDDNEAGQSLDAAVIQADLVHLPAHVLPEQGKFRYVVPIFDFSDGFTRAVRSQAVAGIAHDAPLLEQKHAGISRSGMDHKHLFLAESGIPGQRFLHLHINEARHFAVVNAPAAQTVGHMHPVHEYIHIIRFRDDVRDHQPYGKPDAGSIFLENFQVVPDDLHATVHRMAGNAVKAENIPGHGNGLLEEIQHAYPVLGHLRHHQAHGAGPQVDDRLR